MQTSLLLSMIDSYESEIEQLKQIIAITPENHTAELAGLFRQLDRVEESYKDFLHLLKQETPQV